MLSPNQCLRCFAKVFYRQLCNGVSFGPRPTEQDCEIQILLQKKQYNMHISQDNCTYNI